MKDYKPEYLGKVVPASSAEELTSFLTNNYDAFSKLYEALKNSSDNISDILLVDIKGEDISVKVLADDAALSEILANAGNPEGVILEDGVLKTEMNSCKGEYEKP